MRDLVVDLEDAEIVKLIFQKYVYEGYGALRLCHYLMEQKIHRKDGKEITVGMINRAVQNSIYIGVIYRGESKSEILPHLRIIDDKLFARAQEIASTRKVRQREVPLTTRGQSLLVGNVYCGCCWQPLGKSILQKMVGILKICFPGNNEFRYTVSG